MESEVLVQLGKLRDKYRKGIVSVLVGAGFSRNTYEGYPLWPDLLQDMVEELYKDEIDQALIRFKELHPLIKFDKNKFVKDEAKRVISKVGYLKMVSEYIAKKGYREAIEHYIEERIPYIDADRRKFRFSGKNKDKEIDIVPDNFAAHRKLLEGSKWERIYTTNYDRLLEYAMVMDEKNYKVITKASELSVSKETPSIIKLHGDLHNPQESKRQFVFDGNPHQQYIISKEDYTTYPNEHEAFTQLMRISLLQGAFCLIGFSGDDPNFINWLSWVRDVLVTEGNSVDNNDERYKIFLIGYTREEPDEVKQIFYENHNIFFVPLLREEVLGEIGASQDDKSQDLFCKFFAYLYKDDESKEFSCDAGDVLNRRGYSELWQSVYEIKESGTPQKNFRRTIAINKDKLGQLFQLKKWNRLVSSNYKQIVYIQEIWYKEQLSLDEARLFLLALSDSGIVVDDAHIQRIKKAGIGMEGERMLERVIARTISLCYTNYEETIRIDDVYEEILRALYILDFNRAKGLLRHWYPTGVDCIKKAFLLGMFDKEVAKQLLEKYLLNEPMAKEQFYATRILNMVEDTFPVCHSTDRYENANVQDYFKLMSDLTKRVQPNTNKIVGYGDVKYKKEIFFGSKPTKQFEALSLLNFLNEAPASVSYRNFHTLISPEDWYAIHKELFEAYPLPTLYYGLQCTDDKVKKRIGQDYAYSDSLAANCLDDILKYLLQAYLAADTPNYIRPSILQVAKELFAAVEPIKWEGLFMNIWEQVVLKHRFQNEAKDRRFDVLDDFINKALNSIKSLAPRQTIISDLLVNAKVDVGFVIDCLYYLHVIPSDLKNDNELQLAIHSFVDGISTPDELNVAGNIYRLLTKEQLAVCSDKCAALLSDTVSDIPDLVYRVSQFFVKDDAQKRRIFWESVCENKLLWNNGILSNHSISSFQYIKVSEFMRRIYVDQKSLETIYAKMKSSAGQLVTFINSHENVLGLSDIDGLLVEMLTFMNHFRKRLSLKDPDFDMLYDSIYATYYKVSGLKNIEDGLLSEYESEMASTIRYIINNKDLVSCDSMKFYIDTIIKRVLLRNGDGLDTCVAYLRYFLKIHLIDTNDKGQIEGLKRILDRYTKESILTCNMDLVLTARNMWNIASFLKRRNITSPGVDYWIDFKKQSRFYTNFD